jgi:hypothetical protein
LFGHQKIFGNRLKGIFNASGFFYFAADAGINVIGKLFSCSVPFISGLF